MTDQELMTIGRFSQISGLTVHTLRHYDDIGLLTPAEVDPVNGYRRYRRDQIREARVIQGLRWIDLPIEETRKVVADPNGDEARQILRDHRRRLELEQGRLKARVADVDHYLSKGITMAPITGTRPVQLKVAVDDVDAAVAFYQKAFGFHYDVTRRTGDAEYSGFVFSKYGENDFFLLHLMGPTTSETDRPGPTTFGLLVDDLDEAHARALAGGAVEAVAQQSPEGMPRCSAVKDPDNNWIWLYQG